MDLLDRVAAQAVSPSPLTGAAESVKTDVNFRSALGATFFLIGAAGVAPACLVGLTPGGFGPWIAMLLVVEVSALRLALLYYRAKPALYELSFWIFSYLFLGMAPLAQLRLQAFPETTPGVIVGMLPTSAGVVLLGLWAFLTGTIMARNSARSATPRVLMDRRVRLLSIPALVLALVYNAKVGFGAYFGTRDELILAREAAWPTGATGILIQAACTIPLLVCVGALIQVRKKNKSWEVFFLLVAQFALLIATTNPISSARIAFGTAVLSLMAMLGTFSTPRRFRISLLAILAGLVLVFPYADTFRHAAQTSTTKGNPVEALTRGDFDSFAQINNAVYYVKRHGVTYGRQAAGAGLFFIPRDLWPGKPEDTGVLLAKDRQYGFQNLSAPLWAELYVNGAWPAVGVGMTFLGWWLRRLDLRRIATIAPTMADNILPFYLLMLLRGSLLQAMATWAAIVLISRWLSVAGKDIKFAGATECRVHSLT